jgi:phospholipid/cholesterol/gamma-HCH transport system substrate-binding protein
MNRLERAAGRIGIDPRALLGLSVLIVGTLVWALMFTGAIPALFGGSSTTVRADFASVGGVVKNDPVRVGGVTVGRVSSVTLDPGARGTTLELSLDGTAGQIYNDASAAVRWRTVLGANYSVALTPGTPGAGSLGSRTVPQSQTSDQVEVDEITRSFRDGAQAGFRTMLQELPKAFADRQAPAATFKALADVAPVAAAGVGAVRGQQPDADLRNLVRLTGQAANALDAPSNGTQRFIQDAGTLLQVTAASQADIKATLSSAANVLPRANSTLASVDQTLGLADPLVSKLLPPAPSVAPTLSALHPTLNDTNTLLNDATPLLRSLRPTVSSLATTASVGVPTLRDVQTGLASLDKQILPALDRVSPESKKPTYVMIGGLGAEIDGLAAGFDRNGYFARLTGSGSSNVLDTSPCKLNFGQANSANFLTCISIMAALQEFLNPKSNVLGQALRTVSSALKASPDTARKSGFLQALPTLLAKTGVKLGKR